MPTSILSPAQAVQFVERCDYGRSREGMRRLQTAVDGLKVIAEAIRTRKGPKGVEPELTLIIEFLTETVRLAKLWRTGMTQAAEFPAFRPFPKN